MKEDIARLQRRIKSGEKVGGWVARLSTMAVRRCCSPVCHFCRHGTALLRTGL